MLAAATKDTQPHSLATSVGDELVGTLNRLLV
jgi:hypothetical protein